MTRKRRARKCSVSGASANHWLGEGGKKEAAVCSALLPEKKVVPCGHGGESGLLE